MKGIFWVKFYVTHACSPYAAQSNPAYIASMTHTHTHISWHCILPLIIYGNAFAIQLFC